MPAGVATGQKLKLRGKGNDGPGVSGSGPPGDLLVLIDVQDHALFRRRGNDLLCEVPVTFAEAALGEVPGVPVGRRGTSRPLQVTARRLSLNPSTRTWSRSTEEST